MCDAAMHEARRKGCRHDGDDACWASVGLERTERLGDTKCVVSGSSAPMFLHLDNSTATQIVQGLPSYAGGSRVVTEGA